MKLELTDWYPPEVKPVRVGFYQRKYISAAALETPDYWNGKKWFVCPGPGMLTFEARAALQWRGLARKPK